MNQRWAIFISGRGSNAQAAFDQFAKDIKIVISSKEAVWGLVRARRAGVPVKILSAEVNWHDLSLELRRLGINKIFLLGFMRLVPPDFVNDWAGDIFNLHPSILPAFPGLKAIEKSFEQGGDMGVTVHHVTAEMDAGHRLLQVCSLSAKQVKSFQFSLASEMIARDEQRLVRRLLAVNGELSWSN